MTEILRKMRPVLVLGGSSPVSTRHYDELLDDEMNSQLGEWNTAVKLTYAINFQTSVDYVRRQDWENLGNHLAEAAAALVQAAERIFALDQTGEPILICASNTWHVCAPRFTKGLNARFVHIADTAAQEVLARGFNRVALFGTHQTMKLDFMKEAYRKFGIDVMVPEGKEATTIDDAIFNELVHKKFYPKSKAAFLEIGHRMIERGAQAIVLACTEIPLLIQQEDDITLPMIDTTRPHARKAVELARAGMIPPTSLAA